MNPSFASSSRCKRSFGVNVKNDRGLEQVKRLVAQSDVVIENSTVGTMADMGLDYDTLKAINPSIVMISSQLIRATFRSVNDFKTIVNPINENKTGRS